MAIEFRLPELGENVTSGTVGKLLVSTGDIITAGQNVLEIETDKAVAEIPCPTAGKVTEILVAEGAKVNTNDIILMIDPVAGEKPSEKQSATVSAAAKKGESAPKTSVEPAPDSGTSAPEKPIPPRHAGPMRAAPSVRQLARENDVDINEVPTADPSGRVTAQDILAFAASRKESPKKAVQVPAEASKGTPAWHNGEGTSVVQDKWGVVVHEAMNTIRSRTAERLSASWQTIPHVTHFDKADITELEAFRKQNARKADEKGARLTITAFILKALPEVLKRYPRFNASVDMDNQELLLKRYYNLGVAVDTPTGLVVPVIRDADQKSVVDITLEMAELAEKARARKLTLEEMQGGTFTVSNLGGLGGHGFTPIINAPEVAILGLSRSRMEAVYDGQGFQPRLMLPMSLSYDHRIIDGADAARFLRFLAEAIEQPWRMLLGLQ